jgi:hypothetical protein
MRLSDLPLTELLIRPPGFMAVSKVMGTLFGPTETPLRLLPWLASLGSLVMAPMLARHLFRAHTARLLFIAVIALHPCAIDFGKEFKPYAVSMALHVGLMLLTLRFIASQRESDLHLLLGGAVVSTIFAQDVIFSFPGVFLIAGYEALRRDRKKLVPIVVAAGVILAVLGAQYLFIWSQLPKDESAYWGHKYGVFYSEQAGSFAAWFAGSYGELAAFPGYERMFWKSSAIWDARHDLRNVAHGVWIALHFIGIVVMFWRKRFREATLLFMPIVVLVLFNLLGLWPFGVFRTNVFLVANTAGIAAMAFDGLAERERPFGAIVPSLILLVIPFVFFEDGLPPTKRALTRISEYPAVLEFLAEQAPDPPAQRQNLLLLGQANCSQWRYFLRYHPKMSRLRSRLEQGFDHQCIENSGQLLPTLNRLTTSETRPTWLVTGLKFLPSRKQPELVRIEREKAGLLAVSAWVRPSKETYEGSAKRKDKGSAKRKDKSSAKRKDKSSAKRKDKGSAKRSKKASKRSKKGSSKRSKKGAAED